MKNEILTFIIFGVVLLSSFTKIAAGPIESICSTDSDCSPMLACRNKICINPCSSVLGDMICTVKNHNPELTCKPGFVFPEGSTITCIASSWPCHRDTENPDHSVKCESP